MRNNCKHIGLALLRISPEWAASWCWIRLWFTSALCDHQTIQLTLTAEAWAGCTELLPLWKRLPPVATFIFLQSFLFPVFSLHLWPVFSDVEISLSYLLSVSLFLSSSVYHLIHSCCFSLVHRSQLWSRDSLSCLLRQRRRQLYEILSGFMEKENLLWFNQSSCVVWWSNKILRMDHSELEAGKWLLLSKYSQILRFTIYLKQNAYYLSSNSALSWFCMFKKLFLWLVFFSLFFSSITTLSNKEHKMMYSIYFSETNVSKMLIFMSLLHFKDKYSF